MAISRAVTSKRGQVLAFYAILLPVILLPLTAYVVNAAFVSTRAAGLQEATAQAVEAAAQQVDVGAFRSRSLLTVDPLTARAVVIHSIRDWEPGASVESVVVVGSVVTVSTREAITLPFNFMPEPAIVLHARASARLVAGYDRPSSLMPLPRSTF
jgi:uncharacterized protein (UPF0333 family)